MSIGEASPARHREVSIGLRAAAIAAYLLLLAPVCIWLVGWLRPYYSLPCAALLVAGLVAIMRSDYAGRMERLHVSIGRLVAVICIMGAWAAFSGTCGIGYGGYDVPWRTALLNDLVAYQWPVVYSTGYAMAYYICFWMIPALMGKLFGLGAAFFTMWAYETAILVVAWMLFCMLLPDASAKAQWMVLAVFLLWCGLNLLGACIASATGMYDLELGYNANYSGRFYFRCNIDCLEESYNQIAVWLAVPLFLGNRKMHSYMYLAALLAGFSPWAVVGFVPIMIVAGVIELREGAASSVKLPGTDTGEGGRLGDALRPVAVRLLRGVFGFPNIAGVIGCAIPLAAFFAAASQVSGGPSGGGFGVWDMAHVPYYIWLGYFVFEFCQLGIFMLFLTRPNRRDALYWTVVASLVIIPFFWVGDGVGRDFCMDVSLPALAMLMAYSMSYMHECCMTRPLSREACAFLVVLALCFVSPVLQIAGQAQNLIEAGSFSVQRGITDITTYEGLSLDDCGNFVASQPQNSFFFKNLAR